MEPMTNQLLHLATLTVLAGLFMFLLDLLTVTSPLQKGSTMFTVTIAMDRSADIVQVAPTQTDAIESATVTAASLSVELGGLNTSGHGLVYDLDDFSIVGTWTVAESVSLAERETYEAAQLERFVSDPQTTADYAAALIVATAEEPSWWDLDEVNETLTLTLTEAELDGWADEYADDLGDWLESVYCDPMERADVGEYVPEYGGLR